MTRPRRHLAGQVVSITRRCLEGRFFMRPDGTMNAIAAYAFARAAQLNGVKIHAIVVMSNHVHIVLTDVKARRSAFMRDAMSLISRARNWDLGRPENFWGRGSYCETVLLERDAQERKLLYTILNPVKADLVERVEEWPGFMILPRDWGKTMKVPKPDTFFGPDLPDIIELTPERPAGYDSMSPEELIAHFAGLIREGEDELGSARRLKKKRVLGVKRVLKTNPLSRPSKPLPRRKLRPRFASKVPEILIAAIARERAFQIAYRRERERWLKGKKGVVFPCGTVWLRRNSPVKCRDPDASEAGLASMM